jgi:hypothetical protein
MRSITRLLSVSVLTALAAVSISLASEGPHMSGAFHGPKANTGFVSHSHENGKSILRVSPDFKVPDTPAPTWRVVDSKGNIYTLDAFKIKGGEKRQVTVPSFVPDIARVQVYCAWAEVLLGEASFPTSVK